MAGTYTVDDRGQRALMRHYEPAKLKRVFQAAARAGAKAAEPIIVSAAPTGKSERPSQFYRREGLGHGTFRGSVKARNIRKRGINKNVIGYVVGPAGKHGFTRHWVSAGTRPHRMRRGQFAGAMHPGSRGDPWVDRAGPRALDAASRASDAVILRYVSKIPGA